MTETEGKILDIDLAQTLQRLADMGAELEFEQEFDAIYYDHAVLPMAGRVLRLRKEGDSVMLTMKGPAQTGAGAVSREETEVSLDDWDKGRQILEGLGYHQQARMRKIRKQYAFQGAHIVIDTYLDAHAFIPPFVEIEAPSESEVIRIAGLLGHGPEALRAWTAADVVRHYQGEG